MRDERGNARGDTLPAPGGSGIQYPNSPAIREADFISGQHNHRTDPFDGELVSYHVTGYPSNRDRRKAFREACGSLYRKDTERGSREPESGMDVKTAIMSAVAAETAWDTVAFFNEHPNIRPSNPRRTGASAWRFYDWISGTPSVLREPNLDTLTKLPHHKWSGEGRDRQQHRNQYWVDATLAAYLWYLDAIGFVTQLDYEDFGGKDRSFSHWVAYILIKLSRDGYFNPREDIDEVIAHGFSERTIEHLKDNSARLYGLDTDYASYMSTVNQENHADIKKADFLYWLCCPDWVEEAEDVPKSIRLLELFATNSVVAQENAFLFGLGYALSEQEPICSKSQFRLTYPHAWIEFNDNLSSITR